MDVGRQPGGFIARQFKMGKLLKARTRKNHLSRQRALSDSLGAEFPLLK
jgi:hypothetical protein